MKKANDFLNRLHKIDSLYYNKQLNGNQYQRAIDCLLQQTPTVEAIKELSDEELTDFLAEIASDRGQIYDNGYRAHLLDRLYSDVDTELSFRKDPEK